MKQNPTTAIKCRFSNEVHKLVEPNLGVKAGDRWKLKDSYKLTDKQKIELFDKIMVAHKECSNDLTSYRYGKRVKKRIHEARVARGYKFKKKTSKEEYLKMTEGVTV